MKSVMIIVALLLVGCGETTNISDSYNTTNNTDSFNTYTTEQQKLIGDGYVPDEEGVCNSGYFWCSIEKKCLPAVDGSTCPVAHTDEEEAEAEALEQ